MILVLMVCVLVDSEYEAILPMIILVLMVCVVVDCGIYSFSSGQSKRRGRSWGAGVAYIYIYI